MVISKEPDSMYHHSNSLAAQTHMHIICENATVSSDYEIDLRKYF